MVGDPQCEGLPVDGNAENPGLEANCIRRVVCRYGNSALPRFLKHSPRGILCKFFGAQHAYTHDVVAQGDNLHVGIAVPQVDPIRKRGKRCEVIQLDHRCVRRTALPTEEDWCSIQGKNSNQQKRGAGIACICDHFEDSGPDGFGDRAAIRITVAFTGGFSHFSIRILKMK